VLDSAEDCSSIAADAKSLQTEKSPEALRSRPISSAFTNTPITAV
jgi:hypothetical protein